MKQLFFTTLLTLSLLQVSAQEGKTQPLGEFTQIEISGDMDVELTKITDNKRPSIDLVYQNENDDFKYRIKNNRLIINEKIDLKSVDKTQIVVYYDTLDEIEISRANTTVTEPLTGKIIDIKIQDKAHFKATFDIKDLNLSVGGRSYLIADGEVTYLDLEGSTSVVDCTKVESMAVNVKSSNSAEVTIQPTQRLRAFATTGGKVFYEGEPELLRSKTSFGGEVSSNN